LFNGFDWTNFLYVARTLHGEGQQAGPAPNPEAVHRSVTNRAYYAALHLAKKLANTFEPGRFVMTVKVDHPEVPQWFKDRHDRADLQEIGELLSECLDCRYDADYKDVMRESPDNAAVEAIYCAEKILRILRREREARGL